MNKTKYILLFAMIVYGSLATSQGKDGITKDIHTAWAEDFDLMAYNIKNYHPSQWTEYNKIESEVYRREALILETDKTPVDVILRRTEFIINERNLKSEAEKLKALAKENKPKLSIELQKNLFFKIAALRRKVMFSNSLLDFNSLVFLKHDRMARGFNHMVDQYFGLNQVKQGGVYRLDNAFGDKPKVSDVLSNHQVSNGRYKGKKLDFNSGSFLSLDLNYEADKILFAYSEVNVDGWEDASTWNNQPWTKDEAQVLPQRNATHYRWTKESSFHIFEANIDGSNIKQLTDGMWDDFDPCYLPNGRIAFISSRCGGNQRCGWRFLPTYVLHCMMPDGSDQQQLSFHDTNEWYPAVNNDGMLIYTRWDYVDRDSNVAHHLWFCYPDGRNPRSMHANYPIHLQDRPFLEAHTRAIPNAKEYISIAASHHGEAYGSLIMIDQSVRDDGAMSQVKRITPYAAFPESESTPGKKGPNNKMYSRLGAKYQKDWHYSTPWPLSKDLYLCVYDPFASKMGNDYKSLADNNYGIYLVDAYGNRELIYKDPNISCIDPMPLRERKRPTIIPVQTTQMKADRVENMDLSTGTVSVLNVYDAEYPFPEDVKIKELRIVSIFPKSNHDQISPRVGAGFQSLARGVLGTVPVEEDGSVNFECPTGTAVYFQALDEKGMMVQNMRSDTYLHPGENLTCIGCHEDKWAAPKINRMPMALKRQPSKIKPEMSGSFSVSFPRLVQPVLDKKCIDCHGEKALHKPLWGDQFTEFGWSHAMNTLAPLSWSKHGATKGMFGKWLNIRSYSLPMEEGARVSKLYKMLDEGHHGVELTPEEMRRITLWIDCNSNFYGAYKDIKKQAKGKVVLPEVGLPMWTDDVSKIIK